MDNEEIRELLKELKETSDESTAVKSRVVKIHFDTRREAEEREREKERKRQEAERQRLLQEEEEKEKQEALRRKAEEKTEEIVNEAKAEASKAFSVDLPSEDQDQAEEQDHAGDGAGEDDLNLNWKPKRLARRLTNFGLSDEEEPDREDDAGYSEDSPDEGESAEEPAGEEERGSLPDRILGKLRGGMNSFLTKLAREDDEEARKSRAAKEEEEAGEETDGQGPADEIQDRDFDDVDEPEEDFPGDPDEDDSDLRGVPASPDVEMREILSPDTDESSFADTAHTKEGEEKTAEDDWKKRLEEPPRFNLRHVKIPDMPVKKWVRHTEPEEKTPEANPEEKTPGETAPAEKKPADIAPGEKAPEEKIPEEKIPGEKIPGEDFDSDAADFRTDGTSRTDDGPRTRETSGGTISSLLDRLLGRKKEEKKAAEEQDSAGSPSEAAQPESPKAGASAAPPENAPQPAAAQSIEVVNLNENANHRQVEVIDLDKTETGPLPKLSQAEDNHGRFRPSSFRRTAEAAGAGAGAFFGGLGRKLSKAAGTRFVKGKEQPSVSEILSAGNPGEKDSAAASAGKTDRRTRGLILLFLLLAGIVLAGLLVFWAVRSGNGGSASSSGSGITADEGLNVRIRKQPMEYTREGDVTLSIRVPQTIQSVTIDGNSVEFTGDKKTEITWHAEKSSMKLMVVSTDKVRSADIRLAYVDSEAPVISVKTTGSMVTLSAKDDASGVEGIYYGTCGDFSDVPLYQKYKEPFEEEDNTVYYWYAADNAGNMTKPVSGTFVQAESVSFDKDTYRVYPDHEVTLKAEVSPEGAYVSSMTFSSSDENVVKIDRGNVLVPVAEGEAEVTLTADGLAPATAKVVVSTAKSVTISAVGDLTLGTDPSLAQDTSFTAFQIVHGNGWFFQNVKGILSQDDATIGNFEGTLTISEDRQNKKFTFRGDPSYTDILKDGSIDVVTLANNHSGDYGEQGLADTKENLSAAGIDWCDGDDIAYKTLNGVKCAFIGIYAVENGLDSMAQMKTDIEEAKKEDAQIIVVDFHWNSELVEEPNQDMITLAHAAVDSGADLVVGSHSHLVSGIEKYSGKYIVYGLSNFCFGGNLYPNDYDSMIFRQTFTVDGDGTADDDNIEIIPVRISSEETYNNYQPTPVDGQAADQIMQKINQRSTQFGSTWDSFMVDGTAMEQTGSAA